MTFAVLTGERAYYRAWTNPLTLPSPRARGEGMHVAGLRLDESGILRLAGMTA